MCDLWTEFRGFGGERARVSDAIRGGEVEGGGTHQPEFAYLRHCDQETEVLPLIPVVIVVEGERGEGYHWDSGDGHLSERWGNLGNWLESV